MADSVPVVVILGATGAGKSRLALELANRFGGEIINADAMQMYRGLDIVTNKVTALEQEQVKHHVIDFLDPLHSNTVLDFRNRALPIVERLLKEGKIPFICGGTNYYIESLLWKILMDQDLPLILSDSRKRVHEDGKLDGGTETGLEGTPSQAPIPDLTELDEINFECDDNSVSSRQLHELLTRLDPARAEVLHPQERRKVWRSLQVLRQHGARHSDLVASQGGAMGGGLRFPKDRVCLIEVWSEQAVLDARCDGRVEKMMKNGLIAELTDFHAKYNAGREQVRVHKFTRSPVPDYHRGIWQSIGFKEFHPYLVLGPEEREGEEGKQMISKGVELMKIATRQYARRQVKWMKRFLISERDPPPFYRVNSSDPSEWEEAVYRPAQAIVLAVLAGRPPTAEPLPLIHRTVESIVDDRRTYHCDLCDRDFKGSHQFKAHTDSKGHKKVMKRTQSSREDHQLHVTLEGFNPEAKNESAKVLKNTFQIGLTDVFSLLSSVPCELAVIPEQGGGEAKVKSLMKELAKHDIKLSYSRKAKLKE